MAEALANVTATRGSRLAHIGVIRILEREGIAIDVVAGSSMGSLIAAAWAVGKTPTKWKKSPSGSAANARF